MAELPELTILQCEMDEALSGRTIALAEIRQDKCLNVPVAAAIATLEGRRITAVTRRGKWLYLHLEPDYYLLLNLGMGADLWHYTRNATLPDKYQFRLGLDDGTGFTCRFWWFGYIRLVTPLELPAFKETARLGPSPLEITPVEFAAIAQRYPRSPVKSLILDQDKLSGIGNAYAHDILWTAHLHPKRRIGSLTEGDLDRLHRSIRQVVERAIALGGLEADFYRQGGHMDDFGSLFLVGYKEGKPCPSCGSAIVKIETGSTSTFLCPSCQLQ